jgi:hypothetical protein
MTEPTSVPPKPASADPKAAPDDGCESCKTHKKSVPTAQVRTLQLGPFVMNRAEVEGRGYTGVGLAFPPGFGVSREACAVFPVDGKSATDVVTGWSVGASVATPGVGPELGTSVNDSGAMVCTGVAAGSGGPSASWTVVGGGAASNEEYLAQQNTSALARSRELAAQARSEQVPKDGF